MPDSGVTAIMIEKIAANIPNIAVSEPPIDSESKCESMSGWLAWKDGDGSLSSPWFTIEDDDGMGLSIEDVLKHFSGKQVKITIQLVEK